MKAHQAAASLGPTSPYLVISRVGSESLHQQWLPTDCSFDVLLSSYDCELVGEQMDTVMTEHFHIVTKEAVPVEYRVIA